MQGNDIANDSSPVVYVVWEGLLATCGEMDKVNSLMRMRRYKKALSLFQQHYTAIDAMWQAMNHRNYGVSVLSYLPSGMGDLLPEWLDMHVVPYRELVVTTPGEFLRRMPHMPWLLGIADPETYRARAYGSYGRHIPASHAEMIGTLY